MFRDLLYGFEKYATENDKEELEKVAEETMNDLHGVKSEYVKQVLRANQELQKLRDDHARRMSDAQVRGVEVPGTAGFFAGGALGGGLGALVGNKFAPGMGTKAAIIGALLGGSGGDALGTHLGQKHLLPKFEDRAIDETGQRAQGIMDPATHSQEELMQAYRDAGLLSPYNMVTGTLPPERMNALQSLMANMAISAL